MVHTRPLLLGIIPLLVTAWLSGCGGESPASNGSGGEAANGGSQTGGTTATSVSSGGHLSESGGNAASGGSATVLGGNSAVGGVKATGGATTGGTATGGTNATGGNRATGGTVTGGTNATGGNQATGGGATGGTKATGGNQATGGTVTGGTNATGGTQATGGGATGGTKATGGNQATGGTSSTNCSGAPLTGGTTYTSNSYGTVGNGYVYQYWSSGIGSATMTVFGVGAAFSASWKDVGDFLARVGLAWNSNQPYTQLGTVSADYAYTKTGSAGTFSFIGIYGWSLNPMHEYYIVDDWFGSGPAPTGGGTLMGSFVVDGGTYNVYQHTQVNQPDVTGGSSTFVQFFSIRQTPRQCGHISISQHYAKWASLGLVLGNMVEAKLLVEVGGGTGSINFTSATVTTK